MGITKIRGEILNRTILDNEKFCLAALEFFVKCIYCLKHQYCALAFLKTLIPSG